MLIMQKIAIKSFGCSANLHDAELMAGNLDGKGHTIVNDEQEADTVILNICTVKGDGKALKMIARTRERNPDKRLVITGCITKEVVEGVRGMDPAISLLDTHHIDQIPRAVNNGQTVVEVQGAAADRIKKIRLPKLRKNKVVHIVLINEGCLNVCTFCSTKLIKGRVSSYPKEAILDEIQEAVFQGAKEIWLTSQDNGAYGVDLYKSFEFGHLAKEIGRLRGTFWTRLGMANPDNIMKVLPELIEAYRSKNIFRFIHIPVQSGNNRVLKAMNRTYSVEDFVALVQKLKEAIPDITISTDIIVGFPGETDKEFDDTLEMIKKTRPVAINISRYSEREGTRAAEMKQVHGRIRKQRSRIMTDLYLEIAKKENERWIGWQGNVLIDEKGKNDTWVGRNDCYKPVVLKGDYGLGDIIEVKITHTTSYDLRGTPLSH